MRQLGLEGRPAGPHPQPHPGPVIEARTLEMAIFQREPKRLDQVQSRSHGQRSATDVAGVPVNLRLDERDVERGHGCPSLACAGRGGCQE